MLKHLLRYLTGTTSFGILLKQIGTSAVMRVWSDVDWALDHSERRSLLGYILQVDSCSVAWSFRPQSTTAQFFSEAVLFAFCSCICYLKLRRATLQELQVHETGPTEVFQSNLCFFSWTIEVQGLRTVPQIRMKCFLLGRLWSSRQSLCRISRLWKTAPTQSLRRWLATHFAVIESTLVLNQAVIAALLEGACWRYILERAWMASPAPEKWHVQEALHSQEDLFHSFIS